MGGVVVWRLPVTVLGPAVTPGWEGIQLLSSWWAVCRPCAKTGDHHAGVVGDSTQESQSIHFREKLKVLGRDIDDWRSRIVLQIWYSGKSCCSFLRTSFKKSGLTWDIIYNVHFKDAQLLSNFETYSSVWTSAFSIFALWLSGELFAVYHSTFLI